MLAHLLFCLLQSQAQIRPTHKAGWSPFGEDWTHLDRKTSKFQVTQPFVAEHDVKSHFTREVVRVQWRSLDPINLYIIKPNGLAKPPVVVLMYSYPQDARRFLNDGYCEEFTQRGFAVVGFESAMTGDRYRLRPMKEWFVSELREALVSSVHDVEFVLDYLQTRQEFDMSHVGMFGQGSGGAIAILAASSDARIRAVDALNPWSDWRDWLELAAMVPESERIRYRQPEFLKTVAGLDPVDYIPKLANRSVRINLYDDDTNLPPPCIDRLRRAARTTSFKDYSKFVELYRTFSKGRNFDWLAEQMRR